MYPCKKCNKKMPVEEYGNVLCSKCDKRPRCAECGVILRPRNKGSKSFFCAYCENHPLPEIDSKCCDCGAVINQTFERWKEHGNWCDKCLDEIDEMWSISYEH